MKRYHEEKHIIGRRCHENRKLMHYEPDEPGRFRKTHIGCNKASCQLCHPEKYPRRIPTRKELQAKKDFQKYDEG
jgi:hypothetical protein